LVASEPWAESRAAARSAPEACALADALSMLRRIAPQMSSSQERPPATLSTDCELVPFTETFWALALALIVGKRFERAWAVSARASR